MASLGVPRGGGGTLHPLLAAPRLLSCHQFTFAEVQVGLEAAGGLGGTCAMEPAHQLQPLVMERNVEVGLNHPDPILLPSG